jgi:DNA repair exonuclease SbcCD ATPase subunit
MKTPPFHVTRLEVGNFKRIIATAISPETGKPILLTGDNGQGKSSILDSILWAFTNSGVGKPIHEGAKKAIVGVEISDGSRTYLIKRTAKGDNKYLEVTDKDGGKVEKPQAFLDSLVGNLAFDPEAFARLKDKQQADQLRQATGLDTAEIDAKIATTYTLRTAANKEETAAEAAYRSCPTVASMELREAKSAGGMAADRDQLRDELAEAVDLAQKMEDKKADLADVTSEIEELQAKLAAANEKKGKIQALLTECTREALEAGNKAKGHSECIAKLTAELDQIDAINAEITTHNKAVELRTQRHEAFKTAHEKAEALDKELGILREQRAKLITDTKMPVDGLAIEDDTVTLDGVPLVDLNTAKRIEVATRIAIAQNPQLGVIFVREGALINDSNLAVIAKVAQDAGMQLWIEKFQPEAGSAGLHIVEGLVNQVDGKPAAPEQMQLV